MRVVILAQREDVRLDPERIAALYMRLGQPGAEDIVCRAMEELALRLSMVERMYRQDHLADLRKTARGLVAIADQVGMCVLARVAGDVTRCIDAGDGPGLAATLSRLLRVGERSLTAVWDLQDIPG